MGLEQRSNSPSTQFTSFDNSGRMVEVKIFGPWKKRWPEDEAVRKLLDLEPRIYNAVSVKFDPSAIEAIQKDVSEGYMPGAYANHQSQYDGPTAGKVVKQLLRVINSIDEGRYNSFVAPIATSIGSGDQDPTLRKFFEGITPRMRSDGLLTTDFTRQKDEEKYDLARTKELMHEFNNRMLNFFSENSLPFVFPETTLEGGRRRRDGKRGINGMQAFEKSTMRRMARLVSETGRIASFIPVGISGTYKILSPDDHRPPGMVVARAKSGILPMEIVKVRIGKPIRWDEMIEEIKQTELPSDEAINNYMGKKVAALIPENERGFYGQ